MEEKKKEHSHKTILISTAIEIGQFSGQMPANILPVWAAVLVAQ